MCQQQMQLANESGLSQTGMTGWLLAVWGETLAELNDLDEAIQQAKKGVELFNGGGTLLQVTWSYMCLVRILFSRGDLTGAEEIIYKIEKIASKSHVPPWITAQMTAWQARLWLAQDKLEAASKWLGHHRPCRSPPGIPGSHKGPRLPPQRRPCPSGPRAAALPFRLLRPPARTPQGPQGTAGQIGLSRCF